MAEEVKIVDVAGGPAAEATLQELLKTMKQMAASTGKGEGAAGEAQKQYNQSVKKGVTVKKQNTKATEENTTALEKMSSAMGRLVGGVISGFTSIIGYGISVATNLFKAFGDGTGTLTDMISQVPIFGSVLAMLTAPFDDTLRAFQSLATSGATFNNSLTELRASAAGAKVSLDAFTSFISANTEKFAAFGGTVTQGAESFNRARKAMRVYEQDLLSMGLTFEEINEGLADYMSLQRVGSRNEQRNMGQLAKQSAEYSKTLMTLSKLTGEDVKSLREKQAAQQTDLAFQMKLGKMTEKSRAKTLQGLAEAQAAGPVAVQRFKEEVMGFPPMTRTTQLFTATMSEANEAIRARVDETRNESISQEQFLAGQANSQAKILANMLESAESMENVLTAGALSGEGVGSEILQMLQDSGVDLAKYIGLTGENLENAIEQDIEAAQKENNIRNDLIAGLTSFQNTLRDIREAIELNIIGPIGNAIGPQLSRLGEMFQNTTDGTIKPAIDLLGDMIQKFTSDINNFGFKDALSNLMTDIGQAAKPVFESMIDSIKGILFGQSVEQVRQGLETTEESLAANAADIQAQIDALNTELPQLEGASADSARAQIEALEEQLGRVNNRINETSTEMENATGTTGILSGLFDGLFESIDVPWDKVALGVAAFSAVILGLGFAAKFVSPGLLAIGAAFGGIGLAGFGIAALIEAITDSMDTMADGLERMQELDPEKLLAVGENLGPLTDNLMSLAAGGIVASFIGEGTFENLASGLSSLASVPGEALASVGQGIEVLSSPLLSLAGSGIVLNFVGDNVFGNLADQLKKFESLNPETLHQVGPALVALNEGIEAFTGGGVLESLGNAIGNFFSGLFGGNEFDDLVENLKKFEGVNTQKIYEVGQGLQGIANFVSGDVDVGDIEIGSKDLERLNTAMASLDPSSITTYSGALEELVEVLTRLNQEMNEFTALSVSADGTGAPGVGGKTTAAGVLSSIGGSNSDQQLVKLDQLNTTMMSLLTELRENTEFNRRTSRAVRAGGNLQS